MNTIFAIAGLLIAATGGAATIPAFAPSHHADTTCQDLAGEGQACVTQDGDCTTGSCSITVCVTAPASCDDGSGPSSSTVSTDATPTCVDLAGNGNACYEADQSSGSVDVGVHNSVVDSDTHVDYTTGL
ncbi:MAG: hypothetical protein V4510_04185 [bacterium]